MTAGDTHTGIGPYGLFINDATQDCQAGEVLCDPVEDVYKIYAESFRGADHLRQIQEAAQALMTRVSAAVKSR